MTAKPNFEREGRQWPNREASRFVRAGGLNWHVQVMGTGPAILLLHGAGAATHSWRDLAPRLAREFTVIAPDLPGHGFTETPPGEGLTLPGMARAVEALLEAIGASPAWIVGHSAGAAVALRMRLDKTRSGGVIGLNAALAPFPGMAANIFPVMAKLLFVNPLAIRMFAWRAGRPGAIERLIESTGSKLDRAGLQHYAALIGNAGHVAGTLGMMAHWDLNALRADLPAVDFPLILVAAECDRAVPADVAYAVEAMVPGAQVIPLPGLGHLAHEEAPTRVADIVVAAIRPTEDTTTISARRGLRAGKLTA